MPCRYWGYEIATEGDSFLLAFHDPSDAVEWAVTTQQALLSAAWPRVLERHDNTCIRLTPQALGALPHLVSDILWPCCHAVCFLLGHLAFYIDSVPDMAEVR